MAPFIFIACEKSNDQLGFQQVIGSVNSVNTASYDSIIAYTQNVDSVLVALIPENQKALGGYTGNRLVGVQTDGSFGKSEASFVSQMILQDVSPDFGANPVVDSVFLFLKYNGAYGDTSIPMDLEVNEIINSFHPNGEIRNTAGEVIDSAYYSNYKPVIGDKLGELNGFLPRPHTPVMIEGNQTVATLKIPLDINYFQQRFANVGNGAFNSFSSNGEFMKYFKGIQVKATNADGAILYFDLSAVNSRLLMYFHNDEKNADVELNFSQKNTPLPISFNIFDQDYSNYPTGFDLDQMDTIKGETVTYTEAMGGVATVIEIPGIDTLVNSDLLINQAILEIYKARGSGTGLEPPSRLEIREFTKSGPGNTIKDFNLSYVSKADGVYRSEELRNGYYQFNITRYLFDVVNGNKLKKLAIVPLTKTTAANRVILQGGKGAEHPVRLKIYYTKP